MTFHPYRRVRNASIAALAAVGIVLAAPFGTTAAGAAALIDGAPSIGDSLFAADVLLEPTGGNGMTPWLIGAGALVLLAGILLAVGAIRRRKAAAADPTPGAGPDSAEE